MSKADQRAKVGVFVFRVADADARNALQDLGFKRRFQGCRDKHAGAVGAHLARAVEVGHHRGIGGAIQVGVVENDQWRLAAQLSGTTVKSIRHYEHIGLLPAPQRRGAGQGYGRIGGDV